MKPPPHQNPVTRRDVATGARTALLSRLGAVIEIVAQPAYTWMFGLATYGLYTVLWALVNLIENIADLRSEEHTSELQSLMRISYAGFCLQKKKYRKYIYHTKDNSISNS